MTWLEYLRALWPVVVALASFIAGLVMLWMSSKFIGKPAHDALAAKVETLSLASTGHGARIKHLEVQVEAAPTRQELQDDIASIAADMAGVKSSVDGLKQQLATTNSYLHTLIEKGLPGAGSRR